ncbi:unnamed protein product [Mytilus coruscus]|uniref:RNase H type-1 domain-containing protein n=1 Tax=Mytilus coruscus TaxID=42192 RepID=A0A6J8D0F3_MYTCO|nr:unnamed protein product [Mytilus coruscus]
MPLQLRRDHLSLKYYARTKQNPSNPANQLVDDCIEYQIYNHKWNDHNIPYGFRVQNLLKDNDLDKIKLVTKNIQDPPPWIIGQAKTSSNIKNSISKKENPHIIKTKALEYIDNAYKNHLKIYTDGSKDPASGKTGYAFLIPSRLIESYKRTSDNLSVYTTEMTAIYQSLKWLFSNQQPGQKVVILTDSYSAIQSIQNNVSSRPDILEPIQILACRLKQKNIEVTIEWIPAHVGILGNEQVDKLAKLALSNDKIDLNLSLSANEFIAITTALYKKKWQARWDNTCSLWSRSINNTVNKKPNFYQGNRYHAKTITRLRLGTTLLPGQLGQYIRNVSPICNTCGNKEDIEHVLVNCINHSQARQNLQSNLDKVQIQNINTKILLDPPKDKQQYVWSCLVHDSLSTEGSSRRLNKTSLRRSTTLQELSGSVTQNRQWSSSRRLTKSLNRPTTARVIRVFKTGSTKNIVKRKDQPTTLQELSGSVTQKWSQAVTGSTEGSSRRLNKTSLRRSTTLQELSGSVTQKWSQAVTGSTASSSRRIKIQINYF